MIAFRYLRARRAEGMISVIAAFSLLGIALGVMTLVVVLSVMNGVRQEMIKSIIGLEGHVTVYSNSRAIGDYNSLTAHIAAMPETASVVAKIEGQIMASHNGAARGALVIAYPPADLGAKNLLLDHIVSGNIEDVKNGEGVMLGSRMAENMRISLGDSVTLISPEGHATIAGTVPRVKTYKVVAIFSVGMFAYDNGLVVMPFAEAQNYFKLPEAVNLLEINLNNSGNSIKFARQLATELGANFRVYDWQRSNAHILSAVIVQRNVMLLVLMLIILVACFNIISGLVMLVREKGKDIAILRTIGATRATIQKIFIICGMSIGILGTASGVALGLLIAFNTENIQAAIEQATGQRLFADELYFLSHLPSKVNAAEVFMVVIMSLALSFLATIYPAWKAAKMNQAEGIKYE